MLAVAYLASPRAWSYGIMLRIEALARSLASVRCCLLPVAPQGTEVLVFHEDFTVGDKVKLCEALGQPIVFSNVDFSGDDEKFVFEASRNHSKGYMKMCQFWAAEVWRRPELGSFSHIMRMDDDSFFIRPAVVRSEMDRMMSSDYSFRSLFSDASKEHLDLYRFTVEFLSSRGLSMPDHKMLRPDGSYNGMAIYNNFHVGSLRLWQHPLVAAYIDEILAINGFLGRGWMDSSVHMMIVACLVPHTSLTVNPETHFGYRHNGHVAIRGSLQHYINDQLPWAAEPGEYEATRSIAT